MLASAYILLNQLEKKDFGTGVTMNLGLAAACYQINVDINLLRRLRDKELRSVEV